MKIERLSENQIRCTLTKNDLAERELLITELAYGTEKARELFRDMMHQASEELGFDSDDSPIMVEAIPIAREGLILIITKVNDPEELDTRFSKFTHPINEIEIDDSNNDYMDDGEINDDEDSVSSLGNSLLDFLTSKKTTTADVEKFVPLIDTVKQKLHSDTSSTETETVVKEPNIIKVFSFSSLEDIADVSRIIKDAYLVTSSIYQNPETLTYYLIIEKQELSKSKFYRIVALLNEYTNPEKSTYTSMQYFMEHFDCIIKSNALEIMSAI